MKKIKLREFKDLKEEEKKQIREELTNQIVERELHFLNERVNNEEITEEEYYKEIGCSKYYAETTSWFVPAVYYDNHKNSVDAKVESTLEKSVFDKSGRIVNV